MSSVEDVGIGFSLALLNALRDIENITNDIIINSNPIPEWRNKSNNSGTLYNCRWYILSVEKVNPALMKNNKIIGGKDITDACPVLSLG